MDTFCYLYTFCSDRDDSISLQNQSEILMRIKAVIAYNGTAFQGFQKQTSTPHTIATAIETALHSLGIESEIVGSGRTDAGVHATGQVIHFELPSYWRDLTKLREHLNGKLRGIAFKHITPAPTDFHARFSARKRLYRYLFKTSKPSLFEEDFVTHLPIRDFGLLEEALGCFVGEHNFSHFLKTGSETKNNIREIHRATTCPLGKYHAIYFEANGFLRAQVRMMIDFAVRVADGELTLAQLREQLCLQTIHSRRLAPPQGLYLARVIY
jgi:tRNA pseudouridine38-40 synthase